MVMYQSHPLEDTGVRVYLSTSSSGHHAPSSLAKTSRRVDDPSTHDPLFQAIHPLDECMECRSYTRHVDETFRSYLAHKPATFMDGVASGRHLQLEEDTVIFSRYRGRLQAAHQRQEDLLLSNHRYRDRVENLEAEVKILRDRIMAMQIAYDEVSLERGSPPLDWPNSFRNPSRDLPPSPLITQIGHTNDSTAGLWHDDMRERTSFSLPESEDDDDFLFAQQIQFMEEEAQPGHEDSWEVLVNGNRSEGDEYDTASSSSLSLVSNLDLDTLRSEDSSLIIKHSETLAAPLETDLSIQELSTLIEAAQEQGNNDALKEVKLLIQDAERTPRKQRTAAQLYLLLTWRTPSWVSGRSKTPESPAPGSLQSVTATSRPIIPEVFVDASSYGIGFVFNEQWLAWKFTRQHPEIPWDIHGNVIMSWAELIAVELGVLTLIEAGYHDARIVLRSDNDGVVNALREKRWTPRYNLDGILKRILCLCHQSGLELVVKWVPTKVNPADKPSRGVFPPPTLLFPHPPVLPKHLTGIIDNVRDVHTL